MLAAMVTLKTKYAKVYSQRGQWHTPLRTHVVQGGASGTRTTWVRFGKKAGSSN
jgi:hypothetical protein